MYLNEKLKDFVGEPVADAPLKKAEPFSLESLIAWLETQPAENVYPYEQPGKCLWAQYTKAMGGRYDNAGHYYSIGTRRLGAEIRHPQWESFVAMGAGKSTYGAALTRAQAALERLS